MGTTSKLHLARERVLSNEEEFVAVAGHTTSMCDNARVMCQCECIHTPECQTSIGLLDPDGPWVPSFAGLSAHHRPQWDLDVVTLAECRGGNIAILAQCLQPLLEIA